MKDIYFKKLIKFLCLLLLSLNVFSGGNESDSLLLETLGQVLIEEYNLVLINQILMHLKLVQYPH